MSSGPPADPTTRRRRIGWTDALVLAALTVAPLVLGGRGQVNADTKQYLYLSPLDLLDRARVLWDSRVGGGAVTHQAIGYLWPMGPYYALTDALGLPDWLSQRLWVGGLQLTAALGALALFRHLLPRSWVQVPAAALYGLSPFVLGLVTGQSGLLLPFAALGWLVLTMALAVEGPLSWRPPAAFALIVTTCGSLNGSSVFFVVLAAVLWVPFRLAGRGPTGRRDGLRVLLRAGGLTALTQLWWLVAYSVGGRYGLPVLDITETVRTTNATSSAPEVLRGLGYWTFYGADTEGQWLTNLSTPYQTSGLLLLATFAVPVVALLAGSALKWRPRAYFGVLVGLGTILAVGAFPSDDPSVLGGTFESLSRHSELVLSLRNTQRAGALVALGLAGLVAGGLTALQRHHLRLAGAVAVGLTVSAAAALPAQWRTGLVAERFHRPEELPAAWRDAADLLDDGAGRVLELPGSDFAAYRWGYTLDPVSVGLTERSVLARELVPMGGDAGVDLLEALDRGLQEGWFEPEALAPVARLLGASDVLVRNDLEYERYRTPRPAVLWPLLLAAALEEPDAFGAPYANVAGPVRTMVDEIELSLDGTPDDLPQVAVLGVPDGGRAPLSAVPVGGGVVVDGDGEGIVAAAAAGLLEDLTGVLLLGADVASDRGRFDEVVDGTTRIVLTDTNRKRAHRWYTLRENVGATEPAGGQVVPDDDADARLSIAGEDVAGAQSVAQHRGVARVWATTYGEPASLLPEERPANAFDGDLRTAWRSERTNDGTPRVLGLDAGREVDADHLVLMPPRGRLATVFTTRARITLDGDRTIDVSVTPEEARDPDGVRVELDGRPFRTLEIEVLTTDPFLGRAGFAEVAVPGVQLDEVIQLPTALVDRVGADLADAPVAVVLTRLRANPAEPKRADPELAMARALDLPVALSATLSGVARIDPGAPEPTIDELLGAGPDRWPARARSSAHLPGSVAARASAALDHDADTAWSTGLGAVAGQWWEVDLDQPTSLDHLSLDVVVDDHHSTPTSLEVSVDGGEPVRVDLPALAPGPLGTTRSVDVPLPAAMTGRTWRVALASVAERTTNDWYTGFSVALPVALAEVRMPGLPARPSAAVDTGCRDDLFTIDGTPAPVRVTGSLAGATAREALLVEGCDEMRLPAGPTDLRTAAGLTTGLDLDRLVLRTPRWDAPDRGPASTSPEVTVTSVHPGDMAGSVTTDGEPFWLVLDESMNEGWELSVEGATVDGPRPLDGYAAGWLVVPEAPGRLAVHASWQPQRTADVANALSAAGVVACLLLLRFPRRRAVPDGGHPEPPTFERHPMSDSVPVAVAGVALALVLVSPLAAVAAAGVALAGWRWPWLGRLAPGALVAASGALVVVAQVRHHYPAAFAWPARFPEAHELALLGTVLLLVTSLAAWRRR